MLQYVHQADEGEWKVTTYKEGKPEMTQVFNLDVTGNMTMKVDGHHNYLFVIENILEDQYPLKAAFWQTSLLLSTKCQTNDDDL